MVISSSSTSSSFSSSTSQAILVYGKRPFGVKPPGVNTSNYIDEDVFIKLKMNHHTICYVDQKVNGEMMKICGTVMLTTHLVKDEKIVKPLRFQAKIVRNLGFDSQANFKLWKKCGMDPELQGLPPRGVSVSPSSPPKSPSTSPPNTHKKDTIHSENNNSRKTSAGCDDKFDPFNNEEYPDKDMYMEYLSEKNDHENHSCIHGDMCYDPPNCDCTYFCGVKHKKIYSPKQYEERDNFDDFQEIHYEENFLYDEVDRLTPDHNYQLDESMNEKQHCPGCIFLNSQAIASQWLDNPDCYSPKLLSHEHSPAQCQMKDLVMDLIFEKNLNLRFYCWDDYVYMVYPYPKIPPEHNFGT